MIKKVFVIPHTHWDREWFFTSERAKAYLVQDLKEIIDHLERNENYGSFLLDGQTSLIEDYLSWRPQDLDRVKKLVKEKKLFLGPWYTQTDQFVTSGESVINNLRIGMSSASDLGGYMNVAYVPDSFGQESSMPQIYSNLGIKDAVLYRGFSKADTKKSEFVWQGEDGAEVRVFRMACGYFIGGVVDETKLAELMTTEPFKTVVQQATTNNILFPNGSDMAPLRSDLPELIAKLNNTYEKEYQFKAASLPEYIAAVKKDQPDMMLVKGEQDSGKDMRVHKSIYSSRADIKKLNTELQNYLTNIMQPVLSMGSYFGLDYPFAAIKSLWQKMGKNAAHDSMGNCVSDQVNSVIKMRYLEVDDTARSLVDSTLRFISTRIKDKKHPITLTVFNTLPFVRKKIITKTLYSPSRSFKIVDSEKNEVAYEINSIEDDTNLIKAATIQLNPGEKIYIPEKVYRINLNLDFGEIPPYGYKQFNLIPLENKEIELNKLTTTDTQIENEYYQISVNADGSLNILDKLNGKLYPNQAILEENGDGGDSYNYSPAKKDLIIYSTGQTHQVQVLHGKLQDKLIILFNYKVPKNLEMRSRGITDTEMPVKMVIKLTKSDKMIKFKVLVDNAKPLSHRLCVDFASQLNTNFSIADIQFGTIKRPLVKEKDLADWEQNQDKWQEKPISINTMQSFVCLSNTKRNIAVVPQAVREYECVGAQNSVIRLTLFRSFGTLGKSDLLYRPGRASGDETVATPDAQLNRKLEFKFALTTGQSGYDQSNLANEIKDYETPLQVYEYAEFLNGRLTFPLNPSKQFLESQFSLFKTENKLTVSTIEKSRYDHGYNLRLYNPTFHQVREQITFAKKPKMVQVVDLRDHVLQDLTVINKKVTLPEIGHAKFITIYFEF